MDALKKFVAKDAVKVAIAILAFSVPLVAPLLPPAYGAPFLAKWNQHVMPLLVSLGLVSGGTSNLRSDQSRANLPPVDPGPAPKTYGFVRIALFLVLVVLAALTFAMPLRASASPLTVCVSGCKLEAPKVLRDAAPTDLVVTGDVFFFAPSVGLNGYTHYSRDGVWQAGLTPGVGYGIKWAPAFWTATPVFLALDIYAQVAVSSSSTAPRTLNIDLLPTLTVANLFGGGCGGRFRMAMESGQKSEQGWLCTIGFVTSAGLP